jgi:hypothetical protein
VLDDLCCQIHGSFSNYELKRSYDQDMIRQSVACPGLGEVSLQNSYQNLQSNQNLHDDTNIINTVINHDLELDEFEYQGIGHVFHDPIPIYMEEIFISKCQLIPTTSLIFHSSKVLNYEVRSGNRFLMTL